MYFIIFKTTEKNLKRFFSFYLITSFASLYVQQKNISDDDIIILMRSLWLHCAQKGIFRQIETIKYYFSNEFKTELIFSFKSLYHPEQKII